MGNRIDGLRRVVLLIPLFVIIYFLSALIALFLFVWFVIDIVWQILTGSDGLHPGGWGSKLFAYPVDNTRYILLGEGEWSWLP